MISPKLPTGTYEIYGGEWVFSSGYQLKKVWNEATAALMDAYHQATVSTIN